MKLTYRATKFSCYAGYISQAVVNNFTPLLFVMFGTKFGLSITQIASLITVNFVTQMGVDIFGAKYAEKIGYRKILVLSQFINALGLIFLGILPFILPHYAGLIISVIICAVGSGLTEVMISPVIEALPSDTKSASMSFLHSFYCWGCVYTILVSTLYFNIFGVGNWRYLCFYWAILPIMTAILFLKVPINVFGGENGKRIKVIELFKSGMFWVFVLLMLCSGASELAMSQWSSMFAEIGLNVSKTVGDILGPCFFAVCMGIARILFGKLSKKTDMKTCLTLAAILCIIAYIIATVPPFAILNLIGCGMCGFSVGIMWPGVLSLSAQRFPEGGTALFGLLALAGDMGCVSGPELTAVVSEISSLKTGLLAAAIFPVLMILLILILRRNIKKQGV